MNIFDSSLINFLNSASQKSEFFDSLIDFITGSNLIKGGLIVSMLWFFWFQKGDKLIFRRERVIIALVSCLVAIAAARLLALVLPFRIRPYLNPEINFKMPFGNGPRNLEAWSSFPSDHAVLFFSLATGIYLISRKTGMLAYLFVILFICIPRVYMGYHYPTDVIAGAIIGILITLTVSINKIHRPINQKVNEFASAFPGIFYAVFFLLSYQIVTLFGDARSIAVYLFHVFKGIS